MNENFKLSCKSSITVPPVNMPVYHVCLAHLVERLQNLWKYFHNFVVQRNINPVEIMGLVMD